MDYSLLLGVHDLDRAVEDAQQVLEVLKVAQVQVQVEEPSICGLIVGKHKYKWKILSRVYININNPH